MQEKNQKFSFNYIKMKCIRHQRDDVDQAFGYLEYRREFWIGNINLEFFNVQIIWKAIKLVWVAIESRRGRKTETLEYCTPPF